MISLTNSLRALRRVNLVLPSRTLSTSANPLTPSDNKDSIFSSLFQRFSIKAQQERIQSADQLFRAAQHQASLAQWFEGSNALPTSFRPTHALLSMHVWFLHRRLIASKDKKQSLVLQEELFDIFWNDTQARIRAVGVNELTVNKHLKDAQRATFVHITQYDHAFEQHPDDQTKRFEVICDAVWRNILMDGIKDEKDAEEDDVDDEMIRRLGAYVEYQYVNIVHQLPEEYFRQGRIAWGNIPDLTFKKESAEKEDGNVDTNEELENVRGMEFLKDNWVQVLTDAGHPYYWNKETNETSWASP